jgi:hypothetical protein
MYSLAITMALIILIFFVQGLNPYIAGLMAVIPVKILGTSLITHENGGKEALEKAVSGMLVGQFAWGFVLLGAYIWLKYR